MTSPIDFQHVYQHSPVSLWIEDYSMIRKKLEAIRAEGVTDFSSYLDSNPHVVESCMASIDVIDVNDYTLKLFRAPTREVLFANLHRVFRDDMRTHFRKELEDMWNGGLELGIEGINYALDGTPIYILLSRRALPGHEQDWSRILLSLVDITDRKRALERLEESERYSLGLFEHSPVSLWVEDYSAVRQWMEDLRKRGITNFPRHLAENPHAVAESLGLIRVIDINQITLKMFGASSKDHLLSNLDRVFRDEMRVHWEQELNDMWHGSLGSEYEGVNYSLTGEPVDILMRASPMPGAEQTWNRVLIAISDITSRKRAESYLSYLGTHDILTGLKNRAHFEESRNNLQKEQRYPVTIVMTDLNGLKRINDSDGHEAGDSLIRRAAEVIGKSTGEQDIAARIGGDEFAILLPYQDERAARNFVARMESLVELNNQFYGGPRLSFSVGTATAYTGMKLTEVMKQADQQMYAAKRNHYQGISEETDRRSGGQP